MKCSSCGYMMSELDKQCPRCKSPNPEWSANGVGRRSHGPAGPSASGSGAIAVASPPSTSNALGALGAVYTQCAWQRPDGRWLNSKEIAEIEQLAHKYVTIRPSGKSGGLDKIISMMGLGKGKEAAVNKIKSRVTEIGIPFGIFQAYANSLRD